MLSNGFLHAIDLALDRPGIWTGGRFGKNRPVRAICAGTGEWTLFLAGGRRHEARLAAGWLLAGGRIVGLVWRTRSGKSFKALVYKRFNSDDAIRRLVVRMRHPLPTRAGFA